MTRLVGAILAGGQARRFGSDKALALYDGVTLIDRIAAALRPQVATIVMCGRSPGLADRPSGIGPLGGIAAALFHARSNGYAAVVSVPCDTPFLPGDLVARLGASGKPAYVAGLPVIGYWPTDLVDVIEPYLATTDDHSIRAWARQIGADRIDPGVAIANINTPADLATLAAPPG